MKPLIYDKNLDDIEKIINSNGSVNQKSKVR